MVLIGGVDDDLENPSLSDRSTISHPRGKIILVTGGNIGLGKQSVLEYAKHNPALIWLSARSPSKAQAALDEIQAQLRTPANIKILDLGLASLESVKNAASTVLTESARLDILMLNAGIMAAPPGLTKDGYELQFGTNYLGHALLAKLLVPLMEKTAAIPGTDVRIVMVSSKLAMILWAKQASKMYPQFTVASIHPGVVKTNLMNNATGSPFWIRMLGKIANHVFTPVDQGGVMSGEYYEPVGIGGVATDLGKDENLARGLWEWRENELNEYVA
ncbi:hypothetical protein BDV12DRAFT_188061 [Aspergillus spectabilis]